ncbi:unnamed protein product [Cuscuta campestris]|uniref:Uncharacterized protein n=1 Tax=Cuscuta campestris TaxID=132261 RepID=A0A484KBU9_9ASTE|nr:unnamed protein product [Cuscuta campestris]
MEDCCRPLIQEIGRREKRSSRPLIVADPCSKKLRRGYELVEESIVEAEEQIAEIDKESSMVDTDDESETDEELPKIHFPMLDEKEDERILRRMNERLTLERGLKWAVYRFMVGNDDKEKFRSLVESLKNDYNEEKNSLIAFFEGPPTFVMVAVEANTLDTKSVVGISEIVNQFYGIPDVSQTSNQDKVKARLLFFELEVLYLLNRQKIQRLVVAQHCNINIYTSGYPSCDKGQEDMIVDVEGKHRDVCRVLVAMLSCVYEEFQYPKSLIQSMEMRMRNLPSTGLTHKLYVYGRKQKIMASYEDGKEMMSLDYLFLSKPFLLVFLPLDHADLLTREEGKFINNIRGPSDSEFEVRLTDYGSGSVKLIIFGKSAGVTTDAMKTFVKKLRELGDMGDAQAFDLAKVLENRQFNGSGGGYFVGMWLSDDEDDEYI